MGLLAGWSRPVTTTDRTIRRRARPMGARSGRQVRPCGATFWTCAISTPRRWAGGAGDGRAQAGRGLGRAGRARPAGPGLCRALSRRASRAGARRTIAAMPAAQGVEAWPARARATCAVLGDEYALPFANALFDRVLVIHALEEADDPAGLLREVWRVMAPSGRVIVAAANRLGLLVRRRGHARSATAGRTPAASWRRWCARPTSSRWPGRGRCSPRRCNWAARWADGFEQAGARLWPRPVRPDSARGGEDRPSRCGPRGRRAPARVFAPGALAPSPARKSAKSRAPGGSRAIEAWSRPRKAVALGARWRSRRP